MKLVRELNREVWQSFVAEHPQGNIFHTPEMFQVFSRARGHQSELWAVVDGNDAPLALLVTVVITLWPGIASWLTTRAISYGSILCRPGLVGEQALTLLLQSYKRGVSKKVLFTELRNISDVTQYHSILTRNGFHYKKHLNFLVDLNRPAAEVLQNIGSRTRKKIRKGLRDRAVAIKKVRTLRELHVWYELLKATYQHARVPLADFSLFQATFTHLVDKNMAKFLMAFVYDEPVACSLELPYKDRIYGWYGGSNRRHSKFYPNELLHWHILEWGATNGYHIYDFGGAGDPDETYGVRDFKAKFGGRLVEQGRYYCIHAPYRLKISTFLYRWYRKLL